MSFFRRSLSRINRAAIRVAYNTETGLRDWLSRRAIASRWRPAVIAYSGYSCGNVARVLGRVVLAPRSVDPAGTGQVRGWRRLLTLESPGTDVEITLGDNKVTVTSDENGIVDTRITLESPLEPGRVTAYLDLPRRDPVPATIHVVSDKPVRGVICDIDDTVWVTGVSHPFRALWRTLRGNSGSRKSVPGMAKLLTAAIEDQSHPGVVYLSNGPWNFVGLVTDFLDKQGFPAGAVWMTDWGVTRTRWFRDGKLHKQSSIARLMSDLPLVTWVLVGDNGEHDPDIYQAAVKAHPGRVAAVALRRVGLTDEGLEVESVEQVPLLYGDNGEELLPLLKNVLQAGPSAVD